MQLVKLRQIIQAAAQIVMVRICDTFFLSDVLMYIMILARIVLPIYNLVKCFYK
jgi:hypothetical protein